MGKLLDVLIPLRDPKQVVLTVAYLVGGPIGLFTAQMGVSAYDARQAKKKARRSYNASLSDRGLMIRSGIAPRQAVVGRAKVSGPIIYATASGTKKEYLHLVICLAAHECDAIETIYFGDVALPAADGSGNINSGQFSKTEAKTYTDVRTSSTGVMALSHAPAAIDSVTYAIPGDPGAVGVITTGISFVGTTLTIASPPSGSITYTINYSDELGTPLVRVKKHLGGVGQVADVDLVSESGGEWTSAHRGDGITYLYFRLKYDQDVFGSTGLPNISAVVRGAKVRDSRTGTTAWSQNSALLTAWWLQQQELGLRQPAGSVVDAELSPEANICDELVTLTLGGATQKRYTTNGVLDSSTALRDNLELLVSPMAGSATFVQGRWFVKAGAYEAPTLFLDESDFAPGPIETLAYAPRRELFNAVTGTYVDAASGHIERQFPVVENATYQGWDGGQQITREIQMPMVDEALRAQRLGKIAIERARQAETIRASFKSTAYNCKPNDVVALSLASDGWSNKSFVVLERKYDRATNRVALTLRGTAAEVWDWNYGEATTVDLAPNTTLPAPGTPPAQLTGLTAATGPTHVVRMADGTEIVRAFVQWTASTDIWVQQGGRVEIQHKRDDATAWMDDAPTRGDESSGYASPIDKLRATLVRIRPVNVLGLTGPWTTYLISGITGDTTAPANVTGLSASVVGAVVTMPYDACPDDDYDFTELRRPSWGAPVETIRISGNVATWTATTVGSYTWKARHRDRSGNYSAADASVTVTVNSTETSGIVADLKYAFAWQEVGGGATATATLRARRDGTRSPGGDWYRGGSSTVGDAYWVRLTKSAGITPSGSAVGTWLQLSSDRAWTLTSTVDSKTMRGVMDIATDAAGTNIVASGQVEMQATSHSGSIP